MKKLLTFLLSFLCLQLTAQNDVMFELVTLSPKDGITDELISKMKAHNDAYHADNPHGARVYSINTGTQAGKLIWAMGPTTWTDLENRPAGDGHDKDWANVTGLLENEVRVEYFRLETALSNFTKDFDIKNLWIRMTDLKPWQGYRYRALLEKIQKVMTEKLPDQQRGVYWNTMGNDGKRDVMTVQFFDSLSWMDESSNFSAKYEEVHGEGTWRTFMSEIEDIVEGSELMMMSLIPEMGGLPARVVAAERQ